MRRKTLDPELAEPAREPRVVPVGMPAEDPDAPSRSLQELAERVMAGDDFEVLQLFPSASDHDVRLAYEQILREIPELTPTGVNLEKAIPWRYGPRHISPFPLYAPTNFQFFKLSSAS